ncbi:MAG: hypothetical protein JSV99_03680 [Planctomycetota bacterium]|nr:MAG: hypothetical protein JSV99_03680 [Planctomycetota bacterium]
MKAAILLVMAVISTNVWAVWDPNTDPCLVFNMNFENNPTSTTTVDAVGSLVGTAYDYNAVSHDFWEESGKIGTSADFNTYNDKGTGEANDCNISVPADPNFDWGYPEHKFTYTLWFNTDDLDSVTFIRRSPPGPEVEYENKWWEINIDEGKLHLFHKDMFLRMNTIQNLSDLGVTTGTWHFAALAVDRTAQENSKIYVDGLEAPVTYTAYKDYGDASVDTTGYDICPLEIGGAGEFEFEGLLDEIRIYQRVLTPLEVSILHQTDGVVKPMALLPIPRSHNVSVNTDLTWEPAAGATAQQVYFGTDVNNMSSVASGDGDINSVANSLLNSGSPLDLNTTYYWDINSTVGGSPLAGPLWSFTTETGKPFDPSPADGEQDVPPGTVNLQWTGSASATSFDVYFSADKSLVEANDVSARVADDIGASSQSVSAPVKGETYYWRVICNFGGSSTAGDVWSFRTIAKWIVVNTSDDTADYNGVTYDPLTFTDVDAATVTDACLGDDDVAVFKFAGDVNISEYYDMVFIPLFDDVVEADMNALGYRQTSRPMAISVTGNVYLNCKIDASGLEAPDTESSPSSQGRCGGHRGSFRAENRDLLDPVEIFGPGYGATSDPATQYLSCGAGGGYGGAGGDQKRAGGGSGGSTYGYEQIPEPLGGSAGGWSNRAAGGPGGGAVEIAATGNISFGPEFKLLVTGGDGPSGPTDYAPGGGSGGSVKIVAGGSFANAGTINGDGGDGGDTNKKDWNSGGGGGGGRVAIWYVTDYNNTGQITAGGGSPGLYMGGPARPETTAGAEGTVFDSNANPAKADFPTPAEGAEGAVSGPNQIELRWYPGFGATKNEVYLGTDPCDLVLVATINAVAANGGTLRGEQSHVNDINVGETYYWFVRTTYGSTIDSNMWSFTPVEDYKIVFNTDDTYSVSYEGATIGPLECKVRDAGGWSAAIATGSIATDGVAIFNFNGFNYDRHYNIVVLPEYGPERDANVTPTPLDINVVGNFYFDGDLDISGDDTFGYVSGDGPKARSGGHRGPVGGTDHMEPDEWIGGNYSRYVETGDRFGGTGSKYAFVPTTSGYALFGPGTGVVPPYTAGGGGGYGGIGGDSGRGYMRGVFAGGGDYGDEEVPVPFGGSAGGFGKYSAGGAGGGGVEIVASGNVTFGPNADIYAEGGSVLFADQYPSGGGSGGSVRVIAGGSFSNDGIISVCGGDGCNGNEKLNNTSGGGAGGRVAVFYGTTYTNNGQIIADGGAKGIVEGSISYPEHNGGSYGEDGQSGTILASSGSPKKASAPTPRNGDEMFYVGGGSVTLKWYSGYGGTTDQVYFGTNPNPTTPLGSGVSATRGEHSSTVAASISAGNTYYWKVVTDGTVSSGVWMFSVVDWECPLANKPEWDAFYYYDCLVTMEDFAYFAEFWLEEREGMGLGAEADGIITFTGEWLDDSGRI